VIRELGRVDLKKDGFTLDKDKLIGTMDELKKLTKFKCEECKKLRIGYDDFQLTIEAIHHMQYHIELGDYDL